MRKHYVNLGGGLGNQLYILAYADYLKSRNANVSLSTQLNLDEVFTSDTTDTTKRNLLVEIPRLLGFSLKKEEKIFSSLRFKLFQLLKKVSREKIIWTEPDNKYATFFEGVQGKYPINLYYGYFQSHHYISDEFKQKLRDIIRSLKPCQPNIQANDVALHIRRGDFFTAVNAQIYSKIGINYYLAGLDYIAQQQEIGTVYIFSDDFAAIEEEIRLISEKYSVNLVQGQSVLEDMNWLSHFKNYVVGNSTFAWWGAMLSEYVDNLVIVPQRTWIKEQPTASQYLPHWVQLPNE